MTITEIIDAKMPSLTEWLEKINHKNAGALRAEDNTKRDRLEILFQEIGLIYDRPERMTTRDIVDHTPLFQKIVAERGDRPCALRLVPYDSNLPKLRQRGQTLNQYLNGWFKELQINPDDYKAEVVPHGDTIYSSIFVVTDQGVWGEIIPGGHWKLTQGLLDANDLITFSFDFNNWNFSNSNPAIEKIIKQALDNIKVVDHQKQAQLKDKLNANFANSSHIKGYFEFVVWGDNELVFVDYNRLLPQMLGEFKINTQSEKSKIHGLTASAGIAMGKVRIVTDPKNTEFNDGEILVCMMTMVDYIPLMKKASGIITEQGNLLSHAAIVARELKKPCIVGVKNATAILKTGDGIEMDAGAGAINLL